MSMGYKPIKWVNIFLKMAQEFWPIRLQKKGLKSDRIITNGIIYKYVKVEGQNGNLPL